MNKEKLISTAVLLNPNEDKVLRVEAAKLGISKASLAQKVVRDWITRESNLTITQKIDSICKKITQENATTSAYLFDILDRIITGSCDLIEVQVMLSGISPQGDNLEQRAQSVIDKLNTDIQIINNYCEEQGLQKLTSDSPNDFADKLVQEYFETRTE